MRLNAGLPKWNLSRPPVTRIKDLWLYLVVLKGSGEKAAPALGANLLEALEDL